MPQIYCFHGKNVSEPFSLISDVNVMFLCSYWDNFLISQCDPLIEIVKM